MIRVIAQAQRDDYKDHQCVYVGRGSYLGNPYTHIVNRRTKATHVVKSRQEAIDKYKLYLDEKIADKDARICDELNQIYLKAKNGNVALVCYCSPKTCHADYIKQIIENKLSKQKNENGKY
jgi:hypothetical protein